MRDLKEFHQVDGSMERGKPHSKMDLKLGFISSEKALKKIAGAYQIYSKMILYSPCSGLQWNIFEEEHIYATNHFVPYPNKSDMQGSQTHHFFGLCECPREPSGQMLCQTKSRYMFAVCTILGNWKTKFHIQASIFII